MWAVLRRMADAVVGCVPGVEYRRFPDSDQRDGSHQQIDVPAMLAFAAPARGLRILEVGCGRGVALPVIAARCAPARLVGIDIDARLLAEARSGGCAELVHADVRAMPFADGAFDLVVDFGTCYHIAQSARALRAIARVLSPGGRFVYETRAAQRASHPLRSRLRAIDWRGAEGLFGPERACRDYAERAARR